MECSSLELGSSLWEDLQPLILHSERDEIERVVGIEMLEEIKCLRYEIQSLIEINQQLQVRAEPVRTQEHTLQPAGKELLMHKIHLLMQNQLNIDLQSPNMNFEAIRDLQKSLASEKEQSTLAYVAQSCNGSHFDARRKIEPHTIKSQLQSPSLSANTVSLGDVHSLYSSTCTSQQKRLSSLRTFKLDQSKTATPKLERNAVEFESFVEEHVYKDSASNQGSRPVSRASTISNVSFSASIVSIMNYEKKLSIHDIDSIKDDIQDAFKQERQHLLDQIESLEMDQDLMNHQSSRVQSAASTEPTLEELQQLDKALNAHVMQQDTQRSVQKLLKTANQKRYLPGVDSKEGISRKTGDRAKKNNKSTKLRNMIQKNRDNPFLE